MRILIADDEKNIRDSLVKYLNALGWESVGVENGLAAQRLLQEEVFAAIIADLKMPGLDGHQLLDWCRDQGPDIPFLMISAHGDISDAVEAMKKGARDYLAKPFDPEELEVRLKKVLDADRNKKLAETYGPAVEEPPASPPSSSWAKIENIVKKAAPTPSLILITGESGTGKEVLARQIHRQSAYASGPFVAVNIGGLPENLVESELFGYERGAFTGADQRKLGLLETASHGTVFLDEIGELSLPLQVKLLRVLQERKIRRLGGTVVIPVEARILAATHRNLAEEVKAGRFREDLFYRLNVVPVVLPPLRNRREDLPWLILRLLDKLNTSMGKKVRGLTVKAEEKLSLYSFPGNVRELENLLERAMIFSEGDLLTEEDFELPGLPTPPGGAPQPGTLREMEQRMIETALLKWEGNQTRAAEELGITRRTLFNKLKEFQSHHES